MLRTIITICAFFHFLCAQAQDKRGFNVAISFAPIGASNMFQKSQSGEQQRTKAKYSYGLGMDMNLRIYKELKLILSPSVSSMAYYGYFSDINARAQYLVIPATIEFLINQGRFRLFNQGNFIGFGNYKKRFLSLGVFGGTALYGSFCIGNGDKTNLAV